jgi:hypothetical protein
MRTLLLATVLSMLPLAAQSQPDQSQSDQAAPSAGCPVEFTSAAYHRHATPQPMPDPNATTQDKAYGTLEFAYRNARCPRNKSPPRDTSPPQRLCCWRTTSPRRSHSGSPCPKQSCRNENVTEPPGVPGAGGARDRRRQRHVGRRSYWVGRGGKRGGWCRRRSGWRSRSPRRRRLLRSYRFRRWRESALVEKV